MVRKVFYRGPSMNPLLKRGDTLLVVPSDPQGIHPGDVVLFLDSYKRQVVHRVVAVNAEGVVTKGDNNPTVDGEVLAPHEILGRVTAIQRQGRTLTVTGEVPATLYLLKARHWFDRVIFPLLQPVYLQLARSGLFQSRLATWAKPRLIHLPHSEGPEWQLWMGKILIGRKKALDADWSIRRPFRLFVDEDTLP